MDKMQTTSFSSMNKNNFAVRFIHLLTLPVTPVLKKKSTGFDYAIMNIKTFIIAKHV